ncbi:hypothetical protein GUITHDRAFT_154739 [Guillardia theta CCMP2712]|uniref:Uncharacterized protein n=1 Tax=Guillardia theta (strain CCMP2712) TaxID=905079 RepID=L1IQN8_GUITC|nr:hypothetical protein GUITHDRAFT_154739 [Guillardia theta CCMP2712]EKX38382.1 hypothetical protein GUITHDRAFT_154739 [Guillardia theta CCMP2712]|eukprot:XP_005825362.1 hypothetical protein GUITHDRAFT_154739 [Guillardia theta CCMP2712]
MPENRYSRYALAALAFAMCGALALVLSFGSGRNSTVLDSLGVFSPKEKVVQFSLKRARTDLDPGSLQGLIAAADGGSMHSSWQDRPRHQSRDRTFDSLTRLQEQETTQSDRKASDSQAPILRNALGKTLAKYFTTVRSVKDDQGTFIA